MKTSLNGAANLSQQTLDVRHAEAAGHMLLGIIPEIDGAPWNTAEFKPLSATEPSPAPITLEAGGLPPGKKLVWTGIIFAEGNLTPAVAYR
ncbi:MAG: hypothetical protein C0518_15380 [Opitutus sp.]|nr:hypothetical protein [Opitutus sp.]